jgi:hypothetical protein
MRGTTKRADQNDRHCWYVYESSYHNEDNDRNTADCGFDGSRSLRSPRLLLGTRAMHPSTRRRRDRRLVQFYNLITDDTAHNFETTIEVEM